MNVSRTAAAWLLFAVCGHGALGAETQCVNASAFGWNVADATACLQAAIDSGAKKVVIDRQAGDWITRPLFITNSNIEVVLADGVTLKAKRGEFYGKSDCLIRITGGAKNVTLRGEGKAALVMNKKDYLDPRQNYAFSEWRHAVSILSAENVTVKDLTILSSGGDGIYPNGPKNVTLENLQVYDHNRQGMSPISIKGLTVRRCEFNDTWGTPPQSGIDMEPNNERQHFIDVLYEDCAFNNNHSHGIDMYFGNFTSRTRPVSITFRRCVAKGNGNNGVAFMTGNPALIMNRGHVGGFVRFEDCRFEGNGRNVMNVVNHTENGLDISFARCRFDARGSKAGAAISLNNGQMQKDFGGLKFEDCEILLDKGRQAFAFEGMIGVGISGRLEGTVFVDDGESRKPFDFAAFMAKHVPHPELITTFKSAEIDWKALAAPGSERLIGRYTPRIRQKMCVYVQAVPEAGEYRIHFKSRRLRATGSDTTCGEVRILDRAGTDLGSFNLPEGDFEYALKSNGANVYRFEVVSKNTAVIQVSSEIAGGALVADSPLHIFGGKNVQFHFLVPAAAKEVLVNLMPEEPGSAKLYDAAGRLVDERPFPKAGQVLKAVRRPTAADETWLLEFPKVEEDFKFQIGGEAIPLVSTERESVMVRKGGNSNF